MKRAKKREPASQANKIYSYLKTNYDEHSNETEEDYFGMKHTIKASNTTRLWFTNPCGIGVDPLHHKSDSSFSFLKQKSKSDIFGFAETNVHWYLLYNHASLYSRVKRRWKNFKISTSHNKHEKLGKCQPGGTCTVAVGQVAFREHARGQDETGLGRWSWLEFRGKNDHRTRVYTAYRPGNRPPKGKTSFTTVYEQHIRFLKSHDNDERDPRKFFDRDLQNELREKVDEMNIVLMIDVNQNVESGSFNEKMEKIGLTSAFKTISQEPMPPTHHRGSKPISTIYLSANLTPVRAGILPKTIGVQGDHRNMYVDIPNGSFLGVYMYKIVSQPMKRLQLKDSRIVRKFQATVVKHFEANKMLESGLDLIENAEFPMAPQIQKAMEGFDEQFGRSIENGKKKCRKLRMGDIPYSKAFQELRDKRRLWLLVKKKKIGQKISNTTIRRLSKRLRIVRPMSHSLKDVYKQMTKAEKEYRSLNRQTALKQRNHFNEELAAANAINMNASKGKILARIIHDEQVREQARMSRRFFPKRNQISQKVDRVQYFCGKEWMEATSPRDVANACQQDTEMKYKETRDTPLMKREMHKLLGNFAETKFSHDFMDHKAELPDNTDRWTKEMMEKVRHDRPIPRLPILMSPKEVKEVWKSIKEHKAAAPSGRYNGVYKALSTNDDLLKILTISMNIPFITGNPYQRWHIMIDIMAFKKPENIKVTNIRSIIISEADWNAAGKIHVTRRLMKQAEKENLLPQEHMGGRKGRKSIDGVLTKRLILDNSKLTSTAMVVISTDAANCYDRMLHKYISFVCVKWGLAVQVLIALLHPLQFATHHTRTAYGDSSKGFHGTNLQGAGQGNTGAAPFWTAISTPMIELMKQYKMHADFVSPISGIVVILTLLAFVDDTELFITARPGETTEALIKRSEIAINLWREFLYVTGGVMRTTKCAWTLMDYKGSYTNKQLMTQSENPGEIQMPNEDGSIGKVLRYDIDDPREYLGVTQMTSGKETEQERVMEEKIQKWNDQIQQSRLPPAINLNAVMTKIHRSLIYPLPALTIPESTLQKMSDTLYWGSLSKCGIIRTFPIRYRHLPKKYQGLNLPSLYLEQEIGKISEIITYAYTKSVVWDQISLGLEILQVKIGLQGLLFDYDYCLYESLCPECWLKTVWKFISTNNLKIEGWKLNRSDKKRTNDIYIMEELINHHIQENELQTFNECRLYLQVETLSDIVNGDGSCISNCYYMGRRDSSRISIMTWPQIRRPNINKWYVWQKWIDHIWCAERNTHKIKCPLGIWKNAPTQRWEWYYDDQNKKLYHLNPDKPVKVYSPIEQQRHHRRHHQWFVCTDIVQYQFIQPTKITAYSLATVKDRTGNKLRLEGWAKQEKLKKNHVKNVLLSCLDTHGIPTWMFCRNNFSQFQGKESIVSFFDGAIKAVTDASLIEQHGTACIIIEDTHQTKRMTYITKVPANILEAKANDSYRCELCGIWAILQMIECMEKITNKSVDIQLACDNLRSIEVSATYSYVSTKHQHFDIIRSILEVKKRIKSNIEYIHVNGHMDEKKKFEDLTRLEQLNVLCDKYAKESNSYLRPLPPQHMQDEGLSLWCDGNKIYSNFREKLQDVYWDTRAKVTISEKYDWMGDQFDNVCWEASSRATKLMTNTLQIKIAKFVTKTMPVGRAMERRGAWKESYCPRCGKDDESTHHILQCNETSARETLRIAIENVEKTLSKMNTELNLQMQVIRSITEWLTGNTPISTPNSLHPIRMQNTLGWEHFIEGRIHIAFEEYMQRHYQQIGSKKNGEMWVSVMIQTIWTKLFSPMWEHRNKAVHIINDKEKKSREHINLNYSVRELYEKASTNLLLHQDRYLLEESLSTIILSSTARKRGWILTAKIAIRECEKARLRETTGMQDALTAFRLTGSCRRCDAQPEKTIQTIVQKKISKRNKYRKILPPLLVPGRKRKPSHAIHPIQTLKRLKRHPNRKKMTRCPVRNVGKSRSRQSLPTIEEEWEYAIHVRKKNRAPGGVESLF